MGACKAQKLYSSIDEMLGVRDRGCILKFQQCQASKFDRFLEGPLSPKGKHQAHSTTNSRAVNSANRQLAKMQRLGFADVYSKEAGTKFRAPS